MIWDTALLWIDATPDHPPATLQGSTTRFLSQARLADTCLTQQDHALRTPLRIEGDARETTLVSKLLLHGLLHILEQCTQALQFHLTSDKRALVHASYLPGSHVARDLSAYCRQFCNLLGRLPLLGCRSSPAPYQMLRQGSALEHGLIEFARLSGRLDLILALQDIFQATIGS